MLMETSIQLVGYPKWVSCLVTSSWIDLISKKRTFCNYLLANHFHYDLCSQVLYAFGCFYNIIYSFSYFNEGDFKWDYWRGSNNFLLTVLVRY